MSTKTNNVVNIGHNSEVLADTLINTLNLLEDSLDLINQSSRFFERSCKGKMDRFDKSRMDAFEKVEWWQRGQNATKRAVSIIDEATDTIKSYLKANGVEIEKKGNNEKS